MEYLNRELLEELRPKYGNTNLYRYIESRSDYELSLTTVSSLYDKTKRAPFQCDDSEYITDLIVYRYCHSNNLELYVKLLPNYDGPYIRPKWRRGIPKNISAQILAIKPEYISNIRPFYIDVDYYINYVMTNNELPHKIYDVTMELLRRENFLFFCWNLHPMLLRQRCRQLYSPELLNRFLEIYPHHSEKYRKIYAAMEAPPTKSRTRTLLKMTKEEFMDPANDQIPSRFSKDILSDENVVIRIIEISWQWMIKSEYRKKFVTESIFRQVYETVPMSFRRHFPQYYNDEMLREHLQRFPHYDEAFHDVYRTESWIHLISRRHGVCAGYLTDPFMIREIICQRPDLEKYIDQDKLMIAKFRNKSARSVV